MTEYGIRELKQRVKENKVLTFEERKYIIKALDEIQQYRAIGTVEELQKSVKEEDVLKFYYIESEDKYVVGQRVDNFYYGEVGKTGLAFYMSRYLPWGKHVVAPDTLWKEHTYPSEPKEIPFFDWLQGFIKTNMVAKIKKKHCQKCRNILSVAGAEEYCKEHKCRIDDICDIVKRGGVE